MRTSPARTSSPRAPAAAFTLIELLLVLALMSVVLLIGLPAFQSLLQSSLQQEVNHLTGVIRLLRNEAVLTNTRYRIMLNLKDGRYSVERQNDAGTYDVVKDPRELAPHSFPSAMTVQDLVLLGRTYKTDEPDPLPIIVDSSGYVDPFLLHFSLDDKSYTLRVAGFTGRVELVDGHVDE
jgi:prepilin-type N-terminal cleavage/methylation domain-containing protein